MKYIVILLGLSDLYSKGGTGELLMPLDGSIARLSASLGFIEDEIAAGRCTDLHIYCFAGYDRANPAKPNDRRKVALCDQIKRFIKENRPSWLRYLHTNPEVWGTFTEVRRALLQAIGTDGIRPEDDDVVVVSGTNPSHRFRVGLIGRKLRPNKQWQLVVPRAYHAFTWRSRFMEVLSFFGTLVGMERTPSKIPRHSNERYGVEEKMPGTKQRPHLPP